MKRLLVFLSLILIFAHSADALKLYDIECYDDGHLEMTLEGNNESKAYTKDIVVTVNSEKVTGSWDTLYIKESDISNLKYSNFISNEGIFANKGSYEITIDYLLVKNSTTSYKESIALSTQCPGLLFSCTRLNLSIEDCYMENGNFKAVILANGLKQSDKSKMELVDVISFKLEADKNYYDVNGFFSRKGGLPDGYSIAYLKDDKYMLEASIGDVNVGSLFVEFNDNLFKPCLREKYENVGYYSLRNCNIKAAENFADSEAAAGEGEKSAVLENITDKAKGDSGIFEEDADAKTILLVAAFVVLLGLVAVYLVRKKRLSS